MMSLGWLRFRYEMDFWNQEHSKTHWAYDRSDVIRALDTSVDERGQVRQRECGHRSSFTFVSVCTVLKAFITICCTEASTAFPQQTHQPVTSLV